MTINNPIIEIAKEHYQSLKDISNDWDFLVNLSDYVNFILSTPKLKDITDKIEKEREKDYDKYLKTKDDAMDALKQAKSYIFDLIEKNKISDEKILKIKDEIQGFEKGTIQISGKYIFNYRRYLSDLSEELSKLGYENDVKKYKIDGWFQFSYSNMEYDILLEKIDHLKTTKLWHSWFFLKVIPEVMELTWRESMRIRTDEEIIDYHVKFIHLKEGLKNKNNRSDDWTFKNRKQDIEDYKNYLHRVNAYIMQELYTDKPAQKETKKSKKIYYANGVLFINNSEVNLTKKPIQSDLLKTLFKKPKQIWSNNVIVMAVELGMANQFIRDLSVDTKRGLKAKAERGWYPTYTALGYKHNPIKIKGEKEIIVDEERFDLTRKMFDLVLTGRYSPPKVLEMATNDWKLRNKKGKKVAISTFYRILSDPFYYGIFEYPKGTGNWHQGKHKAMITAEEFDRIQILLGKGTMKQRPHTKEFAYTGLMRCGECGAVITADAKVKKQKNGNVHFYTYYHCTKRKDPNCSQKVIRVENLEEQIVDILNKIQIPKGFTGWAVEVLRENSKIESNDRTQIISNHQKAYNAVILKIDGLIEMRASNEITQEEFLAKKAELGKERARLQELLKDQDKRIDDWLEKVEHLFNFAEKAQIKFTDKNTSLREKGMILSCLGSNLTLLNGILSVSLQEPLLHIEEIAKGLKAETFRFEPLNFVQDKKKNEGFSPQISMMLPGQDSNL
ncbi:MAG: recombinase zinc beta ribbon domain-containing protein [Candidatus Moranbacteria bacterium]|nr:recombinase zinc beta ribbon domain-containing protein [Candidatus Moranbacteria bacterium]